MAVYRSPFGVTSRVTPNILQDFFEGIDLPQNPVEQVVPERPTAPARTSTTSSPVRPKRSQDEQDLIDRLNAQWDNRQFKQSDIDVGVARQGTASAANRATAAVRESSTLEPSRKEQLEAEIAKISGGEQPAATSRFGLVSGFASAFTPDVIEEPFVEARDTALRYASDLLGTPARTVQSAAVELSQIPETIYSDGEWFNFEGDSASISDFFKQATDPNWQAPDMEPLQWVGEKFGQDWSDNSWVNGIDGALDFGAKILSDPLTWTIASPLKYAGGAGRAALANDVGAVLRAGQVPRGQSLKSIGPTMKQVTAKPLAVLDDAYIAQEMAAAYRFGEFGLSPATRNLMQAAGKLDPAGIRVFGRVLPNTAGAAELIGGTLASKRAQIGDLNAGLAEMITPADRLGLASIARGAGGTVEQQIAAFTVYEANKFSMASSSKIVNELASENKEILKNANRPALSKARADGRTGWQHINDFMEGVSTTVDDDLVDIVNGLRTTYDNALNKMNALRKEISDKYGLNLEPVDRLDNFVHHTLTPQAASAARTEAKKLNPKNKLENWGKIRKEFNVTQADLARNEGFTLNRTNAKTFLGETLKNKSISEYNEISMRVLGYKFFEDNPAIIMRNYLGALGAQTRRELFIGRLLTTNPKAILPYIDGFPMTPNALREGILDLEKALDGLVSDVFKSTKGSPSVVAQVQEQVKAVLKDIQAQPREAFKKSAAVSRRNKNAINKLTELSEKLRAIEADAVAARQGYDTTLETIVKPLRQRVERLRNAIDADASRVDNARLWMLEKHKQVFPDALERPTTIEGLAKDILDDASTRLRGAARQKVTAKTEQMLAEGATKGRTVDVDGVTMKVTDAKTARVAASKELKAAQRQLDDAVANDPTLKLYKDTQAAVGRAQASADVAGALAGTRDEWESTVGVLYRQEIQDLKDVIKAMPKVGDGYEANVEWLMKVRDTLDDIQLLKVAPDSAAQGNVDALERVLTQMFADEGRVAKIEAMTDDLARMNVTESKVADYLGSGDWLPDLQKGWQEIRNLHVQVSPELNDAIFNVYKQLDEVFLQRAADPATHSYLKEMFLAMNAYFKGTALMTVGYSVRNAMTAAWNNFAMGVTVNQAKRGTSFAWDNMRFGLKRALDNVEDRAFVDAERSGATVEEATRIAARAKSDMESAYMAVQYSGGNHILDEVMPRIGRSKRTYESKVKNAVFNTGDYIFRPFSGRVSAAARRGNEHVEMGARISLALNGIEQGMTPMAAGARVGRVQFDYTQLSKLDERAKLFIPFWVFASRNVPLQVVQQVARPSLYNAHRKAVEASGGDRENLPYYRAYKSPIKLPFGNWWADFDLPQTSVMETIETFTSPRRIYSEITPVGRAPLEYLTGTAFYNGEPVPIKDTYRPLGLTDLFAGMFSTEVGDPELGGIGGRAINARYVDPIKGALPALQNLEKYLIAALGGEDAPREIGGSDRAYQEGNRLNTLFAALGAGIYSPTTRQLEGEQRRRQYDIADIIEELEAKGFVRK